MMNVCKLKPHIESTDEPNILLMLGLINGTSISQKTLYFYGICIVILNVGFFVGVKKIGNYPLETVKIQRHSLRQ